MAEPRAVRIVIQNGRLRDSPPDFLMYKEYHCAIWGRCVRLECRYDMISD